MKQVLKKQASRISSLIKMEKLNSIRPFKEKPSIELQDPAAEPNAPDKNAATELFQRFTADIIRERVVFIR